MGDVARCRILTTTGLEPKTIYPKGDLRRMLVVLAAMDLPQGASLVQIAERSGLDKKSVTRLIDQAREQAGVVVLKKGAVYHVENWGPVVKKAGAKLALTGALNAPTIEGSSDKSELRDKKR